MLASKIKIRPVLRFIIALRAISAFGSDNLSIQSGPPHYSHCASRSAHESPRETVVGGGFGARGRSPQGRPQRSH
jgi:hypothetical protein